MNVVDELVALGDLNKAVVQRDLLADKLVAGEASADEAALLAELDAKLHRIMQFAQRRQIDSLLDLGFAHGQELSHPAFAGDVVKVRTYETVVHEGAVMKLSEATALLMKKHNGTVRRADWHAAETVQAG
jgi:hypothetical protein